MVISVVFKESCQQDTWKERYYMETCKHCRKSISPRKLYYTIRQDGRILVGIMWIVQKLWKMAKQYQDKYTIAKIEKEERIIDEVMTITTLKTSIMNEILQRCSYWKSLIITSFILRFLYNCKKSKLARQAGLPMA